MTLRTLVSPEARAAGDGAEVCEFVERFCTLTTKTVAGSRGDRLVLRPFQRDLISDIYARDPLTGKRLFRTGLVGMPRKNTKSATGAGLALRELYLGPEGGEVYSVAGSRDQARIVFAMAEQQVKANPDLLAEVNLYKNAIEHKTTGTVYRVLSSDANTAEGLNATFCVFDEAHVQPDTRLMDAMSLGSGARDEPFMLYITTAGVRTDRYGNDSPCYRLYLHGRDTVSGDADDPSFFMAWWEPANPDADHLDPEVWREANPGYGDLNSVEDFEAKVKITHEAEWRTKRLNQWVASEAAWLPTGAFDARADALRSVPDKTPVVLGFDGSTTGDASALVACTVADPHLYVIDVWERPPGADDDWRVPVGQVLDAIRAACQRFDVLEIAADPSYWIQALEVLEFEGLPVAAFPQSPQRMIPATQRFYEAVMNGDLTFDGDDRLRRHVANAVVIANRFGQRIAKEMPGSARKVDAAIAAVLAFDRAAQVTPAPAYSWSAF